MKKIILISISIFLVASIVSCQSDSTREIAQENFEEYFKKLKSAYPADKFEYTFSQYSDLFELRPYPEDMIYLSRLDSTNCNDKFYSLYAHKISLLKDDDSQIEKMPVSDELKRTYKKLRRLVLSSKFSSDHNLEKEIELAKRLGEMMKNENAQLSGYGQTVNCNSVNDKGDEDEDEIYIEYDLELNVVNIGIMQ